MNRLLAALTLLLPALALADVDARFARLRDAAEPLGGLSSFLDKYIGECEDVFAGATCKANSESFRKAFQGKKMYMIVTEDVATMLSPGPYQPGSGDYVIHVTPFFPGGKYALTHGAPKKTDAAGNPVLPLISLTGTIPQGWNGMMFARLFGNKGARAQVIFTPKGIWTLPKKGGGKIYGINAQVEAILVTEGRTGMTLGLWIDGKDVPIRR
ncbi:DUF6066 family protein [Myxococcaceae bacterium GXIMD 01537]